MRRAERARASSAYRLFRAYVHTYPRKRVPRPEPKSDTDRANLGLPLREPWFEVKPFDEKKMRFVLRLKDTLQAQPKQKMELTDISLLRRELDVLRQGKQRKMATYVRRFPAAFTLHTFFTPNNKKKTWCGFSADASKLLEEEDRIFQASEALLVQKLRKVLMISMKNRLPIATVDQVRQSLGLPIDFKESLVKKYPDVFLLKERKGFLYLELKDWDESLAISVLEKNTQEGKYIQKSKKKRNDRLTIAENEPDAPCEVDYEHSFLSMEEDDDVILAEEGEEYQKEVLTAMHQKLLQGKCEEMVLADEGDLCDEQSSEHNRQQDKLSMGFQELSNAGSEPYQQDSVAISLEGARQSATENLTDLNKEAHTEDLSVLGSNEHESSALVVDFNKEGQLQAASGLGDGKAMGDEKQSQNIQGMYENLACLRFPWKLKKGKKPKSYRAAGIESFQSLPYISPYRNSRELVLPLQNTLQTDKFLVGLIHEFLSITLEKRATVQQLELFRRPYRLPINLMDFLLKYDGIFYVARGRTKSHVFLKEGYKEFHLLEKEPLLLWQERFVRLAFSSPKPEEHKVSKGLSSQDAQSFSEEE